MRKTAYEMGMSDWSSDGCASDLGPPHGARPQRQAPAHRGAGRPRRLSRGASKIRRATPYYQRRACGAGRGHDRKAQSRGAARMSLVEGKRVDVRVDTGGCSVINNKKLQSTELQYTSLNTL